MEEVVIVSAVRTAIGKFAGSLASLPAANLGATVIQAALDRAGLRPDQVHDVILGQILQAGAGQGPARQAALLAGLPHNVPAMSVNKLCGSGLKAVHLAVQEIRDGDADVVVAGGMESMSQAPHLLPGSRKGQAMGDWALQDSMIRDGLTCAIGQVHMGVTAENIAEQWKISREEQDAFAVQSQNKAEAAIKAGRFREEIVPVMLAQKKGDPIAFDTDEFPRFGATLESMTKLRPAFKKDGTVTAANASGINDGAAAVVVMRGSTARKLGLEPLAVIKAYARAAVDPKIMGTGPIPASRTCLQRAGWTVADLDLIEANEAFASQSICVNREMEWDTAKVNVNGGAIALGHPVGASGARILVTLLHELRRRNAHKGLATLCIGGGMGVALAVER